jgi:hypothetical protein
MVSSLKHWGGVVAEDVVERIPVGVHQRLAGWESERGPGVGSGFLAYRVTGEVERVTEPLITTQGVLVQCCFHCLIA